MEYVQFSPTGRVKYGFPEYNHPGVLHSASVCSTGLLAAVE